MTTILGEIAARRRADLASQYADTGETLRSLMRDARAMGDTRPFAERLGAPGLQIIAEIKRRSPSGGDLLDDAGVSATARAYARARVAAISVLCEPHWFGGSTRDLGQVRELVDVPLLAKEFVVDERQIPALRIAGADAVLLIAALHRERRLTDLVARALDLGLEPLVEIHDEQELDRALTSGARVIGINNRNLRNLAIDLRTTDRLHALIPRDRLVVAESGVRDIATVRDWRAAGIDGVLIGEALLREQDPGAAAARFAAAGRLGVDMVSRAAEPTIKICGIMTDHDLDAAIRAGVDTVGLNIVPSSPRAISINEAISLTRKARARSGVAVVLVTADLAIADLRAATAAIDPDAIQLSGHESLDMMPFGRPVWKALHVSDGDPAPTIAAARSWLAAGATRIMLDTAIGLGGSGQRIETQTAALIAREVPVILAGGLHPANVGEAVQQVPAVGVDVATGAERQDATGSLIKDPLAIAIFTKRARAARQDRPDLAVRPTPVAAALIDADDEGRFGLARQFGGRYVPETLMGALMALEAAYSEIRRDPRFWAELRELLATYAGRPTPLYRADRAAARAVREAHRIAPASAPRGLRLYLKREDLAHTGAHKINNALGQTLLTRRLGKARVIAETGAGQHGVATATACALLDLPCVVYMGAADIERQAPNVLRMRALGTEVRPVTSGTATLKDAVNEAMRDWVTNVDTTHYVLGSAMGPHPYPTLVRDLQRRIGDEAAVQMIVAEGRLPDLALACVGGGSNAIGLLARFIGEPDVRLAVAEAAGDGIATGRHAAALAGGSAGILHGSRSMMLQDRDGQVTEAHSASAGLDYPGVGPQLAALAAAGRLELAAATDDEAFAAMDTMARDEGILPALETAHAIAALPGLLSNPGSTAGGDIVALLGFSGRGDKDLAAFGVWRERTSRGAR